MTTRWPDNEQARRFATVATDARWFSASVGGVMIRSPKLLEVVLSAARQIAEPVPVKSRHCQSVLRNFMVVA